MNIHLISYFIGIFIVFMTHIYLLFMSSSNEMKIHSILNIIGACMIAYYFMNKEKYIKF